MDRTNLGTAGAFALPLSLLLAACDAPSAPPEVPQATTGSDAPPANDVTAPPSEPVPTPGMVSPVGEDGVNDGYPDLTPNVLTPEAERSETGATNVLISWGRAIELQEWDQAWALLSPADQRTWPKAKWAALFADLDKVMVAFAGGSMEGAAGSSYYNAPITITGTGKDGRPVRYEGKAVLRRTNDVPGASPEQLRWRFDRLTLDWTH